MAGERVEPLIFSAWMRELVRIVTQDELGPDVGKRYLAQRTVFLINVLSDREGQSRWCDDITTPAVETCADMKTRALDLALEDLKRRLGSDPDKWRWDALHRMRAIHRPLSNVPSIARFFELTAPIGGDSNTVDVAAYNIDDDEAPYVDRHGPSLREIVDFGDLENSRIVFSTGESGNRLSPLYDNLLRPWLTVGSVPMQTRRSSVERGALGTLHLTP
jgi:penicillin amidase